MDIDSEPAVLAPDLIVQSGISRSTTIGRPEPLSQDDARGDSAPREGRRSALAAALVSMYRHSGLRARSLIRRTVLCLEGGEFYSLTLRRIFAGSHRVEVGLYTHGGCFIPGHMPPGTRIGRYSSIAASAVAFGRNHPMNLRSSHAFFFNPRLGIVRDDIVPFGQLTIGNDVWIGHNAIVMPSVSSIGNGAVIGAGTVVHKDIPPYAVVTGNPARVVRYRFSTRTIEYLQASHWWERSITELLPILPEFQRPLEGEHAC